jgi:uncharacterized membrane protein YhaH (DUF805 family)
MTSQRRHVLVGIGRLAGFPLLIAGETIWAITAPGRPLLLDVAPLTVAGALILLCTSILSRRHIRSTSLPAPRTRTFHAHPLVIVAALSRVLMFCIGAAAVSVVGYKLGAFQFRISYNELINLPARFDAGWYLGIARHGYRWSSELADRQQSVAFFPLFPLLTRIAGDDLTLLARLTRLPDMLGGGDGRMIWGGVLVSAICFLASIAPIRALVRLRNSRRSGTASVLLLIAAPFSLFFGQCYSEGTFLLCSASALVAFRRGTLASAAGWGLLVGLARPNGWTLSLALMAETLLTSPRQLRRMAAALGPAAGAAVFSLYMAHTTGNPLTWVHAQSAWLSGALHPTDFATRRAELLFLYGFTGYIAHDPADALAVACVVVAVVVACLCLLAGDIAGGVFIWTYLSPALALDLPAIGRMTAVLFPVFVELPERLPRPLLVITALLSAAAQCFLAIRFFLWQPPF